MTVTEPAEILSCDACNGTLTFDAFGALPEIEIMNGFSWCATDLSDLWKMEVRGDDRTLTGLAGQRAYPIEVHSVVMQFPLVIVGKYDELGNLNLDASAGLAENLSYLKTNLETPIDTGDGTRPVTWLREDGVTLIADVKVIPPMNHAIGAGALCKAMLTVKVPRGVFTPTGS